MELRKLPYRAQQDGMEVARTVNLLVDGYATATRMEKRTAAPPTSELVDGLIVYADGTSWDPGSGQGIYCYYGSAWNKLG